MYGRARLLTLLVCVLAVAGCVPASAAASPVYGKRPLRVSGLTTEYARNPLGVETRQPRFGWKLTATGRGERQSAYEIEVRGDHGPDLWDSGKVRSSASSGVVYGGKPLRSSTRYHWRVRVWGADGRASPWSASGWWEMGLLHASDWAGAKWIGGPAAAKAPRWPAGSTVAASSTHAPGGENYDLGNAIDGVPSTYWNDNTQGEFPDWLTVTSPSPVTLPGITLWSHVTGGPSDFTVETLQDGQWVRQGTVTGNSKPSTEVRFATPVTTTAVRITVTANWEQDTRYDWTRIGEIYPGLYEPPTEHAAPLLRRDFDVERPVRSARLYISGLAYYQAAINGHRVGRQSLDPAFTMYNKRVLYASHDVTGLLRRGENAIGVELGRGFYGLLTDTPWWDWEKAVWHDEPTLRAKLEITYADGSHKTMVSDDRWRTSPGPRLFDSVYTGEDYDARREQPGWDRPGFDAAGWTPAQLVDGPAGALHAEAIQPITVAGTTRARRITEPKPGVYVFDFGHTTSGWAKLQHVVGQTGAKLTIAYGEKLNGDGTVDNGGGMGGRPLGTDTYVLRGGKPESWEPSFSWKGFRYVQVTGLPSPPAADTLLAKSLHTSVASVGTFHSDDGLYNDIHDAVRRALLNNLYGVPTDTPVYEKNGWTGDFALGMPVATLNFGMARFLEKWTDDIEDAQRPNGSIPLIIPADGHEPPSVDNPRGPSPEWAAAYPTAVWTLWQDYGDRRAVEEHFPGLSRYVDYELGQLDGDGLAHTWLGDWSAPGPMSDQRLTATAYVHRAAVMAAALAGVLGRTADQQRFDAAAARIKQAFNAAFFNPDQGWYQAPSENSYRQTSNALPLAFGLVPDGREQDVADSLAADVVAHGDHLTTGILGTNVLLPMLTKYGHADVAARVADQTSAPSWGDWIVNHGADTMWEGWGANPRSRDHYMFGTVDRWFYEDVAGLRRARAGWTRIVVDPTLLPNHDSAEASIDTIRGRVADAWQRLPDGGLRLDVTVPVGATAEVHVPAADAAAVTESGRPVTDATGVRFVVMRGGDAVYEVASGTYHFRSGDVP